DGVHLCRRRTPGRAREGQGARPAAQPQRVRAAHQGHPSGPVGGAMAQGDIPVTITGNLTNDPELRFTPNGAAVASFTGASSTRGVDEQTNEWKDGDTTFLRCNVWRQYAENVAESLQRGMRVIVNGRLKH